MFKKILVPVDLAHAEKLGKALQAAGGLARLYNAEICFAGVTPTTPSEVAPNPGDYAGRLEEFTRAQGDVLGVPVSCRTIVDTDPAVQMNRALEHAITETGTDLVVMATHLPNVADYVFSGHGAHIAAHSEASVMLIRE